MSRDRIDRDIKGGSSVDILCIGESMALVAPRDGSLTSGDDFTMTMAGAESNVALYASDLGHNSAWASRIGNDPFGARILNYLGASGVDVTRVIVDPDLPTGVFFKDPGTAGSSVYYYRRGSAASMMSPDDLERFCPDSARVVHTSGITPALSSACLDFARRLAERLRKSGSLLSFDVNFRRGLWTVSEAAPILRELALTADVVFVGRDEAEVLWGTSGAQSVRDYLGNEIHLVVKDAEVGATVFEPGLPAVFLASPVVEVVEPVGAGDAFAAGYLSGLLQGFDVRRRLELSHRVAGLALSSTADHLDASQLTEHRL